VNHRLIYFGLGSLLVAVIALGIAFNPQGDAVALPTQLEGVTPRPNDSVLRQAVVEADMAPGYVATLFVDGFRVPDAEVTIIEATGVFRWAPSPLGAYLTEWAPGEHTVVVEWNSIAGSSDAGSFEWVFRIQ
jgi:hypothetical protein